jgi:hypothetical protein
MDVLRSDANAAACEGSTELSNGREGRSEKHFPIVRQIGHQRLEGIREGLRFSAGHVHLPIACDDGFTHSTNA